jgi:nanoRNase/pAp phosphatase (c-di-AMP/oligoRNAs hydrolase)
MRKKSRLSHERKLIRFLAKKGESVSPLLIMTHDFPDPDALASAYALKQITYTAFGIKSRIVYQGVIGRAENRNMVSILKLPVHRLKPGELQKYRNIALVDTQPEFENNPFPERRVATLTVDQHASFSTPSALCDVIDTDCGATSIIMAKTLLELKMDIPERLATALAYGIITDTLNFSRAARPDTISTYLKILPFTNIRQLARIQSPEHDRKYFTMLKRAISMARACNGMIVCHLGTVLNPDEVSQVADFLLSYKRGKMTLTTGRYRSKLHVSLRAKKARFHAGRVLRKCLGNPEDAGGHGRIAGGSLKLINPNARTWKREEKKIQANILRFLKLGRDDDCTSVFY